MVTRMHSSQYGFIPRSGIDNYKEALLEDLYERTRDKTTVYTAFIDLKAAYNRVKLSKLYKIIQDKVILSP